MEAMEIGKAAAADKLTYEIFSILESKFLFGYGGAATPATMSSASRGGGGGNNSNNKVCVLSIDGGSRPEDGLLAAASLVRLEAALQRRAGSKAACLADFFDVAAGSGAGGVLAAMLFARGPCGGRPMYSADDALAFLLRRVRRRGWCSGSGGGNIFLRRRRAMAAFDKVFGETTLRDTVRPVLVPCYDLATRAPFLFSRADADNSPAYDFRLRDACAATCAGENGAAVEVASVDGATRLAAVGGSGVALGNPTAAAITHVLNNRREFPAAGGINNLLVISIGTGESRNTTPAIARIAAESASDMVDQAVAMAFGHNRTSNYVRIQGMVATQRRDGERRVACGGETTETAVWAAEAMLQQRNVEAVMFQGRRLTSETNAEKLERFAQELIREHSRRKQQQAPVVASHAGKLPSSTTTTKKQL
uniref:Patatin n=1 Tax=Leersia perrieri TaxID=77586 RepID=A0A0D9WVE4_9ORYZ